MISQEKPPSEPTVLKLSNGVLSVDVSPVGAELISLRTVDGSEWLWQGDPAYWSSRAPILFPVIGRCAGGRISIGGKSYPMPSHGIARKNTFHVLDNDEDRCRLRLTDTPSTRGSYPFSFQLDIAFSLSNAAVSVAAKITNTGPVMLPCSFGFHPGFVWPLPGGGERPHIVALENGIEPRTRRIDDQGRMLAEIEPSVFRKGVLTLTPEIFVRGGIIIDENWGGRVAFGIEDGPHIELIADGLPTLGIWTRPAAPFLCLEPWRGTLALAEAADTIESRPGIMHLSPGGSNAAQMTIAISTGI